MIDADTAALMASLERGLSEAARGEGHVTTPEQIAARMRARPIASTKQTVKLHLSPEVVAAFKATGPGWQARINDALKDWLRTHSPA